MKILDLGCGSRKYKDDTNEVIGMDKFQLEDVDVVHDIEKTPFPFKDNEFDMIIANHVVEHVQNFFPLMEELYRITKQDGLIKIRTPHFSSRSAFGNPDHKRFFTLTSFDCFKPNHEENYHSKARFDIIKKSAVFSIAGKSTLFNPVFNPLINFNHNLKQLYEHHYYKL